MCLRQIREQFKDLTIQRLIQNVPSNLANIIEATALVPENDRIYPDCPHATAIIIIASYVDDNLAYTNCQTLAKEFEIHCNLKFPMNAKGPVNWYLSVKYDRDPITGAVKNITLRWCAQECTGPHKPGTIYGYADASFADTIPHRLISRIRLHAQRSCYFLARQ